MRGKVFFALIFLLAIMMACTQPPTQIPSDVPSAKNTEEKAPELTPPTPVILKSVPPEIQELFNRSQTRVKSASYLYQGPQSGTDYYQFYVKGNKIKYIPTRKTKTLENPESFDSIFVDRDAKTAKAYCIDATCRFKGFKADLNYEEANIPTILDWTDAISAEKTGEEQIERRATWIVTTDVGKLWVDTYYGIPLKVEANGFTYRYVQLNANSVLDADVTAQ